MNINQNYFVFKLATYKQHPVFKEKKHYMLLFDALSFLKNKYKLGLLAYIILPDQIQLVIENMDDELAVEFTENLKTITRSEIIRLLESENDFNTLQELDIAKGKQKYRLWEMKYELEVIDSKEKLESRINLLHQKPVRQDLADSVEAYDYSSAKFYLLNEATAIRVNDYRLLLTT
ncbi:MAG: hypothetical protein CMO01_02255 [Thalassobius sp.]|nr:hypothetical protein [Thalassovita sp.]|tara:strand:- start:24 stop:551 length:528 start_codon:yes stop_codon:yes gene_type:complete